MSDQHQRPPVGSAAWAIAFAMIVSVAIFAATGLYVWRSLSRVPGAALDQTREVLDSARTLVAAFRQGAVETSFRSYASTLNGTNYLQFATIRRTEIFTRSDRASVFWGTVELPEVIVSATAPVQYTAYLDLDAEWNFRLTPPVLTVTAPPIRFNRPAIDASRIHFEVEQGSLLRDEDAALEELRRGLTRFSVLRSRELVPEVRETGREQVERFVRNWLQADFIDGQEFEVRVRFADEVLDHRGLHPAGGIEGPIEDSVELEVGDDR